MPTPRLVPFAASFGRPECIVVAGGITSKQRKSVSAEVLNDGQWSAVEPLPQCFTSGVWHFTLHNRNLYMCKAGQVLCCSLNTLISSSRTPTKSEVESHAPWRNINTPCDNLFLVSSKSKQLLAFSLSPDNSEVYAFSSYNQSWVHVGDSHPLLEGVRSHASMAVSVPTGDLMILRMDGYPETKAFKISANGEGGWGEGDRGEGREGRGGEWKGREGRGWDGMGREGRGDFFPLSCTQQDWILGHHDYELSQACNKFSSYLPQLHTRAKCAWQVCSLPLYSKILGKPLE